MELHLRRGVETDRELEAWVPATVATTGHPAYTATMRIERDVVLDPELRVRCVAGLRVADASALPRIPRANTSAPRSWTTFVTCR